MAYRTGITDQIEKEAGEGGRRRGEMKIKIDKRDERERERWGERT